jgi:4-oxalocrotonate tautomerase
MIGKGLASSCRRPMRRRSETAMPLIRISLSRGKDATYRRAIADNVYEALRETFSVPENDFFATIAEHGPNDLLYDRHYFNIERSNDLVIIQLTVSNTRTLEQKKALYRRIVERLGRSPGVRPQDVFINLVEVAKENWSFGNGEAQYV